MNNYEKDLQRRALTIKEYAYVWGISAGKVRKDLAAGEIEHFRIGRRVLIPVSFDPSVRGDR